jgi:hypothetical protein
MALPESPFKIRQLVWYVRDTTGTVAYKSIVTKKHYQPASGDYVFEITNDAPFIVGFAHPNELFTVKEEAEVVALTSKLEDLGLDKNKIMGELETISSQIVMLEAKLKIVKRKLSKV